MDKRFKVGDIVICVNNKRIGDYGGSCNGLLTVGEKYKILQILNKKLLVEDDSNCRESYLKERFRKYTLNEVEYLDSIQYNFKDGV